MFGRVTLALRLVGTLTAFALSLVQVAVSSPRDRHRAFGKGACGSVAVQFGGNLLSKGCPAMDTASGANQRLCDLDQDERLSAPDMQRSHRRPQLPSTYAIRAALGGPVVMNKSVT